MNIFLGLLHDAHKACQLSGNIAEIQPSTCQRVRGISSRRVLKSLLEMFHEISLRYYLQPTVHEHLLIYLHRLITLE